MSTKQILIFKGDGNLYTVELMPSMPGYYEREIAFPLRHRNIAKESNKTAARRSITLDGLGKIREARLKLRRK